MLVAPRFSSGPAKAMREKAEKSLWFFATAICGFEDLAERPHRHWCECLDGRGDWGDWRRGIIVAFRGSLKSSIASIAFPLREALHKPNWSCRILGASYRNAAENYFRPILYMLKDSPRRDLFLWLYEDRIVPDWEGTTTDQLVLVRTDPLAKPAISFRGLGGNQEGYHGNLILLDDPEGAESERSDAAQISAERAIAEIAPPLLKDPTKDRILVVGTPHGEDPVVWQLLENRLGKTDGTGARFVRENAKRVWKYIYVPIVDSQGKANWPERWTPDAIEMQRQTVSPRGWDLQYLLKKASSAGSVFDFRTIEKGFYHWEMGARDAMGHVTRRLRYPVMLMDEKSYQESGKIVLDMAERTVDLSECRFYIHFDPGHKGGDKFGVYKSRRHAKPAIVAVAVAPDGHIFVVGCWSEEADIAAQAEQVYRFDRMFGATKITYDAVGAQNWFPHFCEQMERGDSRYRFPKTSGQFVPIRKLGSLSSRLVADDRTTRWNKEQMIVARLEGQFHRYQLHLPANPRFEELVSQLKGFPDETEYVDLIDALAQGPPVWIPPLTDEAVDARQARSTALLKAVMDKYTGYFCPWRENPRIEKLFPDEPADTFPSPPQDEIHFPPSEAR